MRSALCALLALAIALPLSGCGAAMSTYLILRADAELDGAEAAEAEKYAPYEYTSAKEYLHKAREEQGYADFGAAIEYAFKAQELAETGRARAEKLKEEQTPPPGARTEPLPAQQQPAAEEEEPASGIIIRKKPEEAAPQPAPTPPPEPKTPPAEPTPEPELVPPQDEEEPADDEGSSEVQIVPIEPEQPPETPQPQ